MKLYKNILSEVERRKLLKFCKTKLENFGDTGLVYKVKIIYIVILK